MRTLRRVNLIGESKNKIFKRTRVVWNARKARERGEPLSPGEEAALKSHETYVAGQAAARGLRRGRAETNPEERISSLKAAGANIRRGRRLSRGLDTANTAYPLTAGRVHIHEINLGRRNKKFPGPVIEKPGNGTTMKTKRELTTPLARQTVSAQRAEAAVRGPDRPNRPPGRRVLRTAQLGLRGNPNP